MIRTQKREIQGRFEPSDWRASALWSARTTKPGKFINNSCANTKSGEKIWKYLRQCDLADSSLAHNDRFQLEHSSFPQRQQSVQHEMVNKLKKNRCRWLPVNFSCVCWSDRDRRHTFASYRALGHDAFLSHRQQPLLPHVTTNWTHLFWKRKVIALAWAPEYFFIWSFKTFCFGRCRPDCCWEKHACSSCVGTGTLGSMIRRSITRFAKLSCGIFRGTVTSPQR